MGTSGLPHIKKRKSWQSSRFFEKRATRPAGGGAKDFCDFGAGIFGRPEVQVIKVFLVLFSSEKQPFKGSISLV
jgi:hypothetical protein